MKTLKNIILLFVLYLITTSCSTDGVEFQNYGVTNNELRYEINVQDSTIEYTVGLFTFEDNNISSSKPIREFTAKGDLIGTLRWEARIASFALSIYNCDSMKYSTSIRLYKDGKLYTENYDQNY